MKKNRWILLISIFMSRAERPELLASAGRLDRIEDAVLPEFVQSAPRNADMMGGFLQGGGTDLGATSEDAPHPLLGVLGDGRRGDGERGRLALRGDPESHSMTPALTPPSS